MNTSNLKDKITTYLAYVLVVVGAVNTFLQANAGKPIDWAQLILFVIAAISSYMIGKTPSGATKTVAQVEEGNKK